MFKLPNKPSPKASVAELADFLEILAWTQGAASAREAVRYLNGVDDNLRNEDDGYEGCDDEEDAHINRMEEVFGELERRAAACGERYPFNINPTGTVLNLNSDYFANAQNVAYLYLLAATRLNMDKDKMFGEVDGALAMEKLTAHALRGYLGENSRAAIFGTSSGGSFKDRVNRLMTELGEMGRFKNIDGDEAVVHAQDDKLDVVGWIPFKDKFPGQLIVFAQAKTGTNWRDRTHELKPETFREKWLDAGFLVNPIRAFFVAEAVESSHWNGTCVESGLLFDRCRVVEFCTNPPEEITQWTQIARNKIRLYLASC